jgi:hypothetical protein
MIFKYFRRKIQRKKLALLTQNKAKLCKILIITLVFEKKPANYFAENCRKWQKIVIITSTTGANPTTFEFTATTPSLQWARAFLYRRNFFNSKNALSFSLRSKFLQRWRCKLVGLGPDLTFFSYWGRLLILFGQFLRKI